MDTQILNGREYEWGRRASSAAASRKVGRSIRVVQHTSKRVYICKIHNSFHSNGDIGIARFRNRDIGLVV